MFVTDFDKNIVFLDMPKGDSECLMSFLFCKVAVDVWYLFCFISVCSWLLNMVWVLSVQELVENQILMFLLAVIRAAVMKLKLHECYWWFDVIY